MIKTILKRLKPILLVAVILMLILNSLGLVYLYQLFDKENTTLHELMQQQEKNRAQFRELRQSLTHAHEQFAQRPMPSNELQHIEWLIQQAYWQVNFLYQPQQAQKLLEYAYQFSEKNHWKSLETAINDDSEAIQAVKLSQAESLVSIISQLNQELARIHWESPHETATKSKDSSPAYIQLFKPFIQIEKIHPDTKKGFSPNEQFFILQNLKALLPQIQTAAILHQQTLYQDLVAQLKSQWALLAPQHPSPSIENAIQFLNEGQWVLAQELPFQSLKAVQELQQQLNTRVSL